MEMGEGDRRTRRETCDGGGWVDGAKWKRKMVGMSEGVFGRG
jgi:hypothetical protein